MVKILSVFPFGFIGEISIGGMDEGYNKNPYAVYLNGVLVDERREGAVFSIFSLTPGKRYQGVVKLECTREGASQAHEIPFEVTTPMPAYLIDVRDYNATGNGEANDTAAINAAIYTAPEGAVVCIPAGVYQTDHIFLKSNVDIYMEKGAVIRQNPDRTSLAVMKGCQRSYDHRQETLNASWEGTPLDCYAALVYGKNVEGVRIYGAGVLDGNGTSGWWERPKEKNVAYRPRNIFLNGCRHITIAGITSKNSAAWNIHPFYTDDLTLTDITVESIMDSPNTDGINPESCRNVLINGCTISVGDDCIAIKSGKYYMSQAHYRPSSSIVIRNCLMEKGHGGVVIGSEISCGVRGVQVENCLLKGTDRGLRIKTRRGRGYLSQVDGIVFRNVMMEGVQHCFVVNMFYNCDPDGHSDYVKGKIPLKKDKGTPGVGNILLEGVQAEGITGCGIFIYGLPENKVAGVEVKNCCFSYADQRSSIPPAMMDDIFPDTDRPGIYITNGMEMNLEQVVQYGQNCVIVLDGTEVDS